VFLCGAKHDGFEPHVDENGVVRFPSIASFPLMGYESYTLGWPSTLEVVRWMDENEIDLVVSTTPGPVGLVGMLAARLLDTPIVGQYHTNVPEYAFRLIGDRTIGRMVRGYTAWFYNQMAEVLAPTWATREVIARNGIDPNKVVIVQRGVDAETFNPKHRDDNFWTKRGLTGKNTLAYIGRVSVEKNVPFLVQLFRELVDSKAAPVELAVVGDGPYLEQMKKELEGYPVAFTGYLESDELSAAYASSSILLFPSTTDTFGNVVLESLASGTPALVTDLGGPSEIVHHKETGLLLPAGDMKRWLDAIVSLVGDEPRRARMAKNARDYAEDCTFAKARAATWEWYSGHIDRFRSSLRSDLR
jgi:glycosyltransferase involved in cell wall biosynthesis